jgi:hypothetical protein
LLLLLLTTAAISQPHHATAVGTEKPVANERTTPQHLRQSEIVSNLLCIHDGHSYYYKGHDRDPFALSSYVQGTQHYWSGGGTDWGEGSWTNPGAGGLGMYSAFQESYGAEFVRLYGYNNAGAWSPSEQLLAGYRAVVRIGSYVPWPNTRIPCGLA